MMTAKLSMTPVVAIKPDRDDPVACSTYVKLTNKAGIQLIDCRSRDGVASDALSGPDATRGDSVRCLFRWLACREVRRASITSLHRTGCFPFGAQRRWNGAFSLASDQGRCRHEMDARMPGRDATTRLGPTRRERCEVRPRLSHPAAGAPRASSFHQGGGLSEMGAQATSGRDTLVCRARIETDPRRATI
jgi:hypothetical protein